MQNMLTVVRQTDEAAALLAGAVSQRVERNAAAGDEARSVPGGLRRLSQTLGVDPQRHLATADHVER